MQLTAVITPASANIYTGITWTSSNDNVVPSKSTRISKGISKWISNSNSKD